MKKVLVITYYWPPAGGSGVQRWVKFSKYLRETEWEPIIYTVENAEYPVLDESLKNDLPLNLTVLRGRIFEPFKWYKIFTGKKSGDRVQQGVIEHAKYGTWKEKLSLWVRSNFFIPDARVFWIKPSISFLKKYLLVNPVDLIVSTGPPHSTHLIALGIKKELGIPWVADFRDPWTKIFYFNELTLTKSARNKHNRLELEVLKGADEVIVVGKGMEEQTKKIFDRKYHVIYNGFDEDDFKNKDIPLPNDGIFRLTYIGTFLPTQNPKNLWSVIKKLHNQNVIHKGNFQIVLVGNIHPSIVESLASMNLLPLVNEIPYVPHSEVIIYQKQASVLLLCINNIENSDVIITGKFFEYLAANRPILCISPEKSEIKDIINQYSAGITFSYTDFENLEHQLIQWLDTSSHIILNTKPDSHNHFSRRSLTKQLSQIFNNIVQSF